MSFISPTGKIVTVTFMYGKYDAYIQGYESNRYRRESAFNFEGSTDFSNGIGLLISIE